MKLTNYQIYSFANSYSELFEDAGNIYIPAKANFFLQKNVQALAAAASDIEKAKVDIIKHYGVKDPNTGNITVPDENIEVASAEVNDLFNIEQDIDIKMISINDLANAEFTQAQMQLIMLFIQEA